MYKNIIIIPALDPPASLITYVEHLIDHGFENILLIDDGSRDKFQCIFDTLEKQKAVTILRHAVNLGKGRALKDAFNYVLLHWESPMKGVITVDSDGQHSVEDVVRLHKQLDAQTTPAVILGTRDFHNSSVPFKSRFGNQLTSIIFRLLYGVKVNDTQTGLRAIPMEFLGTYCNIPGERFEYETNLLIYAAQNHQKLQSSIIQTIYFDGNSETHFRPIVDSLKIYRVIFQGFLTFIFSSLSALILDLGLFRWFFLPLLSALADTPRIILATFLARVFSSLYNFAVNRKAVFKSEGNLSHQMIRYYTLCLLQMCLSAAGTACLHKFLQSSELFEKMLVDTILFFFSYQIQKAWVFKSLGS